MPDCARIPAQSGNRSCSAMQLRLPDWAGNLNKSGNTASQRGTCQSQQTAVAMAEALAKIPTVEIDPEGTFKYILVTVKVKDGDVHKNIIRGTKSAEYHSKLKFKACCFARRYAAKRSRMLT